MHRFLRHVSLGLVAVYPLFLQAQTSINFNSSSDLATFFNVSPTSTITTQANQGANNSGSLLLAGDSTDLNLAIFKTGSSLLEGRSYTSSYLTSWDQWNTPLFSIGYTTSASLPPTATAGALENNPVNVVAFNLTSQLSSTQVSSSPLPLVFSQFSGYSDGGLFNPPSTTWNIIEQTITYTGSGTFDVRLDTYRSDNTGARGSLMNSWTTSVSNQAFTDGATIYPYLGGKGAGALAVDNFETSTSSPTTSVGSGQTLALGGSSPATQVNNNGGTANVDAATTIATLTGTGTVNLSAPLTLGEASGAFNGTLSGNGGVNVTSGSYTLNGTVDTPLTVKSAANVTLGAHVTGDVTVDRGTLNLSNGATLSGNLTVSGTSESRATVNVIGGATVYLGPDTTFTNTNFRLTGIIDSTLNETARLAIVNSTAQMLGSIKSDLYFISSAVLIGASPGLLTVTDRFSLDNASRIEMELGGNARGTGYDAVTVTGSGLIEFGGTLDVPLIYGFIPQAGDSFELFSALEYQGTFQTVNLPTLEAGLTWDISMLYVSGTLSVASLTAIPEPATYATVIGLGALATALVRRRRTRAMKR